MIYTGNLNFGIVGRNERPAAPTAPPRMTTCGAEPASQAPTVLIAQLNRNRLVARHRRLQAHIKTARES